MRLDKRWQQNGETQVLIKVKKMRKIKLIALIGALLSFDALSQTSFLCIPTAITGFSYNASRNNWSPVTFNADDSKKILKKSSRGWEWMDFGTSSGMRCDSDFNEYGNLNCDLIFGSLKINKKTLRYILTYEVGFIDGVKNNNNTPSITIGTCTPI